MTQVSFLVKYITITRLIEGPSGGDKCTFSSYNVESPLVTTTSLSAQQQVSLSATFGTLSHFPLYKHPPLLERDKLLFPSHFGILVLFSHGGQQHSMNLGECHAHSAKF